MFQMDVLTSFPLSGRVTSLACIPKEPPPIPSFRGTHQAEEGYPEKEEELETVGFFVILTDLI